MSIESVEYQFFIDSFSRLIRDGLKNGDNRLLRGVQTFDLSTYSHLEGIESIISVMFALTVDGRIEAKDLERRLQQDKNFYEKTGTYDKMVERLKKKKNGEIQFYLVKNACSGLKNVIRNLFLLQEEEYIEIIGDDIDKSYVKLSTIWDDFLEYTVKQGYESEIYGSSISRMIAAGVLKRGFRLISPIIKALLESEKNKGELDLSKFQKLFEDTNLEFRHFSNVLERDQKKPKDIKLIHHKTEKSIRFNRASLYTVKKWLNLAEELKVEQEIKLKT